MMDKAREILQKYWGYPDFREPQIPVIKSVLDGHDTLALLPTGGGKSICYQVPGLVKPGLCVVISPLISLMEDQVQQLRKRNIKAALLRSGMSQKELDTTLDNCRFGNYKFLYLSPERLQSEMVQMRLGLMEINLIAIDEAHCVSQWGYDFRPAFLQISKLKETCKGVPFLALTATATQQVKDDIVKQLDLRDAVVLESSFFRKNLTYKIMETARKEDTIARLYGKHPGSGLIYCRTRKSAKQISENLTKMGVACAYYHAGLSLGDRQEKQKRWTNSNNLLMAATTAFGMGIDKPDVRWVFHTDLPENLENYFQETGRAGRDGKPSVCALLHTQGDEATLDRWVNGHIPDLDFLKDLYKKLGSHFQLAYGSGEESVHPFDLKSFAEKYKLQANHVYQGLKILEGQGVLTFVEYGRQESYFQFLIEGRELYNYQVENYRFEPLIKMMLRYYGGITSEKTPIDEFQLAKDLKYTKGEIVKLLKDLHEYEIATYEPSMAGSRIIWLAPRVPEQNLNLDHQLIRRRVEGRRQRMKAVMDYVKNKEICLQKQLIAYFGQHPEEDCGSCTVCRQKQKSAVSLVDEILRVLKNQQLTLSEIENELPKFSHQEIGENLRLLIEENKVERIEPHFYTLKKK